MQIGKKIFINSLISTIFIIIIVIFIIVSLAQIDKHVLEYYQKILLFEQVIINVKNAQISSKIQVQEWKNILLRGNDEQMYDKYLRQFNEKNEQKIQYLNNIKNDLIALQLEKEINRITTVITAHNEMTDAYIKALQSYNKNNIRSFQIVDVLVKGIDRKPNIDLDDFAADLEKYSIEYRNSKDEELTAIITKTIIVFVLLSIFCIMLSLIISVILGKKITKPIITIVNKAQELAQGDLTIVLDDKNTDETGEMNSSLNIFLTTLNDIIKKIRSSVYESDIKISQLVESMNKSNQSSGEINKLAEGAGDLILIQATAVSEITSTIEQIAKTIENQDHKVSSQSASVTQSSAAIEEMIANIKSISANLDNNAVHFESLESAVNEGNENITRLTDTIDTVSRQSDIVFNANAVIHSIAAQTNLLAMNAAIEAAHAGEYGKGFAVVADEIRKLAALSNEQSKLINENIKKLRDVIVSAVDISAQAGSSFTTVVENLATVSSLETEMKHALHEQSSGSAQILEALKSIEQITEEVHSGSGEMLVGSKAIINEINSLITVTEQVKDNIMHVVQKAGVIKQINDESVTLLNRNVESIENMNKEVAFFTVREDDV